MADDVTLTRQASESYMLKAHRGRRTILRYDGIVPGVTFSPKLAPRTQLRTVYELAAPPCLDPGDRASRLLDEL